MAAINFPDSPIDNQVFQAGNTKYVYNATRGTWDVAQVIGATSIDDLADINLTVQPENIALNVDSVGAGHSPDWLWTWAQSTLPFSRIAITNATQQSVPVYQQGTYQINNFANTLHGDLSQTHSFKLKWIEGDGDANLIDWVTYTTVTHSHPDINGGADTLVQRLSFTVPETITLPTLTAPNVTYTVGNVEAGSYDFSGSQMGSNPDLGPMYRGGTYTFNIDATGHPFYLTTDNGTGFESGSYVGEWTDGVTGSRTESGTLTFTVPATAPDVLYYQCGNHGNMRGSITIKNLEVETNENGNYVIYGQHSQEGHAQAMEIRPLPELASQMCIVYDKTLNQWMPQDLATYVENTPSFENKIKEVAGTATLVAPDGTSLVASVDIYSTDSYLPQVGNTNGDIAFVEDTQELKIWKTGTGWLDVTAASTGGGGGGAGSPTITGVSPANYDGTDATSFTITGTNFTLGTTVEFITSNGTSYNASSTSVTDQANLVAITPQAFQEADGPLDVKVTTNTGATVTATDMIQTGGSPVWTTAAGTLYENAFSEDVIAGDNSYRLEMDVNETIVATDPDDQPVTYSVESGSLPPNTTLNALTGNISGTLPGTGVLTGDTTYTFTAGATDSSGNMTPRNFNIIVKNSVGQLYDFITHTFTSGTSANMYGPSLSTIQGLYTTSWESDTDLFDLYMTQNGYQLWTVPASGTYTIQARGARGGGASSYGYGADVTITANLSVNQKLVIIPGLPGHAGNSSENNPGGGGGSFVFLATSTGDPLVDDTLLVAAGGGGGGGSLAVNSRHAQSSTSGGDGYHSSETSPVSRGGSNGLGGYHGDGDNRGSAGAGVLGNARINGITSPATQNDASGRYARRYAEGFIGGKSGTEGSASSTQGYGGFGGGGGGGSHSYYGYGGGGGGYSGGGGGSWNSNGGTGGGGGSFYATQGIVTAGTFNNATWNSSGEVIITKV